MSDLLITRASRIDVHTDQLQISLITRSLKKHAPPRANLMNEMPVEATEKQLLDNDSTTPRATRRNMGAPEAVMGVPDKKLKMPVLKAIIMGLLNHDDIVALSELNDPLHFRRPA